MTKAYDVSFNMAWLRETRLNWTSEAEEHVDALKIAITCTPARLFQTVSLACGGGYGCCNG